MVLMMHVPDLIWHLVINIYGSTRQEIKYAWHRFSGEKCQFRLPMDFLIKGGYKNGKGPRVRYNRQKNKIMVRNKYRSWHTVSSNRTEVNSLPQNLKAETVTLGGGPGIGEAIDIEKSKLWIRWDITS
ncbi:hypothetical protein V6N11_002009 [Hibiscus sabdariffa]|uniref:Uncharacterized protein n=1 Tax=Hibiscus sabdariffa TaxID=183260 RepID=A0ABR2QU47_9ROSI